MKITLHKVKYPDHHRYADIGFWLKSHCRGDYYAGHDWENWDFNGSNRMIEFELESDAVLFALRWS